MTGSIVDEIVDAVACAEGRHRWRRPNPPLTTVGQKPMDRWECAACGSWRHRLTMDMVSDDG